MKSKRLKLLTFNNAYYASIDGTKYVVEFFLGDKPFEVTYNPLSKEIISVTGENAEDDEINNIMQNPDYADDIRKHLL